MTTSGGFTPPAVPACAYAPAMSRAAALALRTAGTLNPNCVVVIPGPTIGTAGNTSATTIELNPVSATDLGMSARVHTTFSASAWDAIFDIDKGAAGTILRLTDGWNNTAQDSDTDSPTIVGQVPWHAGGANFRDNFLDDCVLPGWSAAVAAGSLLNDNEVRDSTVDITGMTVGRVTNNKMVGSTVTSRTANTTIDGNQLNTATVSHLGSASGFAFSQNTMLTGAITIDAATTALVTISDNVIGGTGNAAGGGGGYRITVQAKTSTTLAVQGNRLFNRRPGAGVGTQELLCVGAGLIEFSSNTVGAGLIALDGTGVSTVLGNTMSSPTVNQTAPSAGDLVMTRTTINGATVTLGGSGSLTLTDASLTDCTVVTAAPSTRGLLLDDVSAINTTVTQNGTGSANVDTVNEGSTLNRATVTLSATAGATPASAHSGLVIVSGGVLNVADHSSATPVTNSRIEGASILNLSGAGTLTGSRVAAGATLNTAFTVDGSILEGPSTVTTTAANTYKLQNKSYADWV